MILNRWQVFSFYRLAQRRWKDERTYRLGVLARALARDEDDRWDNR